MTENTFTEDNLPELGNKRIDYLTTTLSAVAPLLGPLLAEVIKELIPGQRLDRIEKYVQILNSKLSRLSDEFIRSHLINENFTDLLEDGLRQAAKSTSDDRREYIASVVATGIASETIDCIETKHLLRILGEINDIEVIWLRYYLVETMNGDNEFRDKHANVLGLSSDAPERAKDALRWSYKEHLVQLGLLGRKHKIDKKNRATGS